jgi:hypothetical protein
MKNTVTILNGYQQLLSFCYSLLLLVQAFMYCSPAILIFTNSSYKLLKNDRPIACHFYLYSSFQFIFFENLLKSLFAIHANNNFAA